MTSLTEAEMGALPQHHRMQELRPKIDAIAEFLIWAAEDCAIGKLLFLPSGGGLTHQLSDEVIKSLLADFFDIGPEELAAEKDKLYDALKEGRNQGATKSFKLWE